MRMETSVILCLPSCFFSAQVHWEVKGPKGDLPDVEPYTGVTVIPDSERNGQIVLHILPENEAELSETFTVMLTGVEGGAEIDHAHNKSVFVIRLLDHFWCVL